LTLGRHEHRLLRRGPRCGNGAGEPDPTGARTPAAIAFDVLPVRCRHLRQWEHRPGVSGHLCRKSDLLVRLVHRGGAWLVVRLRGEFVHLPVGAVCVAGLALLCACRGNRGSAEVDGGPSIEATADSGDDADRCYEVSASEFDASCSVNTDCVVVVVGQGCFHGAAESIQFDCAADIDES